MKLLFHILTLILIIIATPQDENTIFNPDPTYAVVKDICLNSDKYYAFSYSEEHIKSVNNFLKFIQYDFSQEKSNSTSYLYKIFARNDLTLEMNPSEKYVFTVAKKYIFNKGVLIICFLWVALGIFYISGVFLNKEYLPGNVQKNFWPKIRSINYSIILILSIISLYKGNKAYLSFNGTSCFLARFLQEVKLGKGSYNEGRVFPEKFTWPGLLGLADLFVGVNTFLNQTPEYNKEYFSDFDLIKKNISLYEKQILNIKNKYTNYSVEINGKKIIPSYIDNITNIDNNYSLINNLYTECETQLNGSIDNINQIYQIAKDIENKRDQYMKDLKHLHNLTNEFTKLINVKASNITHNIRFLHENVVKDIYNSIKYSFYFNIVVSCSILVILFFLFFLPKFWNNCIKYCLHILWNLSMISLLISFIIFYFLINGGNNILDLIYILHKNVLKVDQNEFFNICLNKDGNLLQIFDEYIINNLKEFNYYFNTINDNSYKVNSFIASSLLNDYKEKTLNYFKNDFLLSNNNKPKDKDINQIISELEKLTQDKWVGQSSQCMDYEYLSKNKIKKSIVIGHNRCFTFKDQLNKDDLNIIYRNIESEKLNRIISTVKNLNLYFIKNEQIISLIVLDIETLKKANEDIVRKINKIIENTKIFIHKFIGLFPDLNRNDKVTDFFNCGVLKNDLITYYDLTAKYVYKRFIEVAILNLLGGIFTLFGVFLIIFYIIWKEPYAMGNSVAYYTDEEDVKDEKERELEIIVENENEEHDIDNEQSDLEDKNK